MRNTVPASYAARRRALARQQRFADILAASLEIGCAVLASLAVVAGCVALGLLS